MNVSLVWAYARANLENQISSTYFGWMWWIVEPLLTMLVYYFVFELLLSRGGDGYVNFLLVGVVSWTWFSNSVTHAAGSIIREKSVIQTISMDKVVFPFASMLENFLKQFIVFGVLLIFLAWSSGMTLHWLYTPLIAIEQLLLIGAISMLFASVVPFFPDFQMIITIGLRAGMFCSGVFYTLDMLSEDVAKYFLLNPMANIIEQYRAVLIRSEIPNIDSMLIISIGSVVGICFGHYIIQRNNKLYPRLVTQ